MYHPTVFDAYLDLKVVTDSCIGDSFCGSVYYYEDCDAEPVRQKRSDEVRCSQGNVQSATRARVRG